MSQTWQRGILIELFLILTLCPKESVNNLAPALLSIEGVKSVNIR